MMAFEDFLIEHGVLQHADLDAVRQARSNPKEPLVATLRRAQILGDAELAQAVSQFYDIPLALPDDWPKGGRVREDISVAFLREHGVFPLKETPQGLMLALADPTNTYAIRALRLAAGSPVILRIAARDEIEAAIDRCAPTFGAVRAPADVSQHQDDWAGSAQGDLETLKDLALETPVVQLVNELLQNALYARATDIHIEPYRSRLSIRMRVDGVLRDVEAPPLVTGRAVVSRLKILSGLDIAERRLPQDGRARVRIGDRRLDLRVATMPTIYGEAMAIRLLENARRALDFTKLGFSPTTGLVLRRQLAAPHGLFVVTGPTGSGKTTTLATALSTLNNGERKILTIEDPIEYELEGVNQTQVKPEIGLTFAAALRSFLRHDPDVIMVGEMRDRETAGIGVHAALTGHLVLTTLHTNTAAGAVTRLLDMGVDAYLLASSLRCVVSQRLVRLLCRHCRQPSNDPISAGDPAFDELRQLSGLEAPVLWCAVGCERCAGTGYMDRCVISELLAVTDDIRPLISPKHSAADIEAAAVRAGMTLIWKDGLAKCAEGLTTLDEVRRVSLDS